MKTKSRKKYRIKSKFRFITSIIIMLGLAIFAFNVLSGLHVSTALTKPQYIIAKVAYGDTLWDIAGRYKSEDTDIRKAVYEISAANDIEASELKPGMTIKVPESL